MLKWLNVSWACGLFIHIVHVSTFQLFLVIWDYTGLMSVSVMGHKSLINMNVGHYRTSLIYSQESPNKGRGSDYNENE